MIKLIDNIVFDELIANARIVLSNDYSGDLLAYRDDMHRYGLNLIFEGITESDLIGIVKQSKQYFDNDRSLLFYDVCIDGVDTLYSAVFKLMLFVLSNNLYQVNHRKINPVYCSVNYANTSYDDLKNNLKSNGLNLYSFITSIDIGIVIGIPVQTDEESNKLIKNIQSFTTKERKATGLPYYLECELNKSDMTVYIERKIY